MKFLSLEHHLSHTQRILRVEPQSYGLYFLGNSGHLVISLSVERVFVHFFYFSVFLVFFSGILVCKILIMSIHWNGVQDAPFLKWLLGSDFLPPCVNASECVSQ